MDRAERFDLACKRDTVPLSIIVSERAANREEREAVTMIVLTTIFYS